MKIISRVASDFMRSTDVWHVESQAVGDTFRICVTAPVDSLPLDAPAKFGALYGVDGDYFCGTNASTVRQMALAGEIPPTFAISIGYPLDGTFRASSLRNRDLTPTTVQGWDGVQSALLGHSHTISSGGADAFLSFLRDELKPVMEQNYPLLPDESTLSGASLGGLFTAYCLLKETNLFRRYNIVSPSLWWDGGKILKKFSTFDRHNKYLNTDVYLSVGGMETAVYNRNWISELPEDARTAMTMLGEVSGWPDMIADCSELCVCLEKLNSKGLSVTSRIVPRETHQTVYSSGLSQALRCLHRTLQKQESWASVGDAHC